jgi:hypothetical protein
LCWMWGVVWYLMCWWMRLEVDQGDQLFLIELDG